MTYRDSLLCNLAWAFIARPGCTLPIHWAMILKLLLPTGQRNSNLQLHKEGTKNEKNKQIEVMSKESGNHRVRTV